MASGHGGIRQDAGARRVDPEASAPVSPRRRLIGHTDGALSGHGGGCRPAV